MRRDLTTTSILGLTLLSAAAAQAQTEPAGRWSAEEIECPGGTDLRRAEAPDGSRSAMWCEASRGTQVARHGPYLELYADGSTARQGLYLWGAQAGRWASFTPGGATLSERVLVPGEAGRHIPQPEDLCPPGSVRDRSFGYDDRSHMNSQCDMVNDAGERVMVGPYVRWDEEKAPDGGKRYVLRSIMTYDNDRRHGPHRVYEGPFGREVLVEEETFSEGHPEGESRAYYLDGSLREVRNYSDGQFHSERVGYNPDGSERWRIVYDRGRRIAAEGDLSVAGELCPGETVPITSADGRSELCARRYLHFLEREGAFVERDEAGRVVESGRYENDRKVELWQAPPGVELPPEVADDVLVAEIQLMIGERPYRGSSSPPQAEDIPPVLDLEASGSEPPETGVEAPAAEPSEAPPASQAIDFDIWFRNRDTKKYHYPETRVEDGVVKVYGLSPGEYYMKVEGDAEPSNGRQRPGDLTSGSEFEVVLGEVIQVQAPLLYTLHLTEPWDNGEDIPDMDLPCGEEALLPGPRPGRSPGGGQTGRFAWRPPAGENPAGIEYAYQLTLWRCDPFARLGVVAAGSTYETAVDLRLPPTGRGEVYELTLVAKRDDRAIGQLMTFGESSYGWALRFRVD